MNKYSVINLIVLQGLTFFFKSPTPYPSFIIIPEANTGESENCDFKGGGVKLQELPPRPALSAPELFSSLLLDGDILHFHQSLPPLPLKKEPWIT